MTNKANCKFCKTEISAECHVCPICRSNLSPFRLSTKNPYLLPILFSLSMIIFGISAFYVKSKLIKRYQIKLFQSAEVHKLKIMDHKMRIEGNQLIVLGELKNEGFDNISDIDIEVYFYGKKNELIKIGSSFINGATKAGETRPFQVLYSCDINNVNNLEKKLVDHYELRIVDGRINSEATE